MTRYRLTAALRNTICAFIRAGGYPHVAAQAAGVPRAVFTRWLKRGAKARAGTEYRTLYEQVLQAQGQSRLAAESRAYESDPLGWLKSGPGRDAPEQPGWANPGKAAPPPADEPINLLAHPETQDLLATLLRLLEPYPEVRASVSQALLDQKAMKGHEKKTVTEKETPPQRRADPTREPGPLPGVSS